MKVLSEEEEVERLRLLDEERKLAGLQPVRWHCQKHRNRINMKCVKDMEDRAKKDFCKRIKASDKCIVGAG